MAFVYELLRHFLVWLAFSTCFLSSISTTFTSLGSSLAPSTTKPHRLVSKLIHPHSILHPRYNPNETAIERMELDIKYSIARLANIQTRTEGSLVTNDYRLTLYPSLTSRTILANISIGTPPIPQLVLVDTGSHVFWVMCTPCSNCARHFDRIFDPSKSYTYSPSCITSCGFKGCKCDQEKFNVTYGDNSTASGTLGRDTLVFETTDEGTSQVSNIEFGCSHNIVYNNDRGYSGILGLNNSPASLASQIGLKFSYCIGNLDDKNYNYNQLILGEGADLEGYYTSFELHGGLYYLTMEGISIGERRLDINPTTFEMREDGTGGVFIDSGTPLTYFVDYVYKLLCREVKNILGWSFQETMIQNHPWLLCYRGSVSRDLVGFPVVTFHFDEGADLVLDSGSFFYHVRDEAFCMAVGPISATDSRNTFSVIGLLAQQSYNVGYDLINKYIYFQRIDCELLGG